MTAHIAKRITYFNGKYYFVSFKDGNIYELSTRFENNSGEEIPRIRIPKNFRLKDSSRFIINEITIQTEQGVQFERQRDLNITDYDGDIITDFSGNPITDFGAESVESAMMISVSRNGGHSFGDWNKFDFNDFGTYPNRIPINRLGSANDFIPQFRFYGLGRFVIGSGTIRIYK